MKLHERDLWGGLGVDGRTILEWTLKRYVSMRGIGLIRLRIGIIGEPLWMRHWTSGFHKPWSIFIECYLCVSQPYTSVCSQTSEREQISYLRARCHGSLSFFFIYTVCGGSPYTLLKKVRVCLQLCRYPMCDLEYFLHFRALFLLRVDMKLRKK